MEKKETLHIDWLSFTFRDYDFPDHEGKPILAFFLEWFPEFKEEIENAEILDTWSYYEVVVGLSDNIRLSYDNANRNGSKGVNISVPSHGLPLLYEIFGLSKSLDPLRDLFILLKDRHCMLSRVDIPYDDYNYKENGFTPYWYAGMKMNDAIRTRMKAWQLIGSKKDGFTFYLGSRANGKLLRIYDKNLESHGEMDCIRYEVEYHSTYARNFMQWYLDGGFSFVALIKDFLEVVDREARTEKKNCPLLHSWEVWLTQVSRIIDDKICVPSKRKPVSFERISAWINSQVWNCLVTYITGIGGLAAFRKLYNSYDTEKLPTRFKKVIQEKKLLDPCPPDKEIL